jgi:hypothetical protein
MDGESALTKPLVNDFNHFILNLGTTVAVVGVVKRLEDLASG